MTIYQCNKCDFKTPIKTKWNNHLKTKKRIEFQTFRKIHIRLKKGEHLQSKANLLEIIELGANLRYPLGSRIRKNSKVRQKIEELRLQIGLRNTISLS